MKARSPLEFLLLQVLSLDGPPRRLLSTLGEGAFFGEESLLTNFPRSVTVTAQSAAQLLEISRELVSDIVSRSPEVLRTLLRFFRDRLVDRMLGSAPLFAGFSPDEAHALAARFKLIELEPKARIVRQGTPSPGLFLLLCGQASVVRGPIRLATLNPGDPFGEMSLLGGRPAMADVETLTKCWLLQLSANQFDAVVAAHPPFGDYLRRLAADRERRNRERETQYPIQ